MQRTTQHPRNRVACLLTEQACRTFPLVPRRPHSRCLTSAPSVCHLALCHLLFLTPRPLDSPSLTDCCQCKPAKNLRPSSHSVRCPHGRVRVQSLPDSRRGPRPRPRHPHAQTPLRPSRAHARPLPRRSHHPPQLAHRPPRDRRIRTTRHLPRTSLRRPRALHRLHPLPPAPTTRPRHRHVSRALRTRLHPDTAGRHHTPIAFRNSERTP